jgi:Transglutaminase-like superfamily
VRQGRALPRLLGALLWLASAPAVRAQEAFFGEPEVEDRFGRPLSAQAPVRVVLELVPGSEELPTELTRRWRPAPVQREGTLVLEGLSPAAPTEPARPQHRKPSFLVDYDEPPFAPVLAALRAEAGEHPTPQGLVRFVAGFIRTKSLVRGYDVASVVARRREGDCSEHAVLLAALARASGHAARVVHGMVLVREQERVRAMGHAWVEVREGKRWQVVDAALPPELAPLYLPMSVMEEEGPGFGMHMLSTLGPVHVRRVRLEPRAVDSAPSSPRR